MLSTDPVDALLDETDDDIAIVDNDIVWSTGLIASAQDVKINTRMIAGEWFYDLDEGIALFDRDGIDSNRVILGHKFSKQRAINEFTPAILNSYAVTQINSISFTFDPKTRTVSGKYEAETAFDDTVADSLALGR